MYKRHKSLRLIACALALVIFLAPVTVIPVAAQRRKLAVPVVASQTYSVPLAAIEKALDHGIAA